VNSDAAMPRTGLDEIDPGPELRTLRLGRRRRRLLRGQDGEGRGGRDGRQQRGGLHRTIRIAT
jgi:hypothetical protein